jgi:hypothetical protein
MMADQETPPKLMASTLAELIAAGVTGEDLIAAVARLEVERDRVVAEVARHLTLEFDRTRSAEYSKQYRDRIKRDRQMTAEKFADSPIGSVASGPRPHNPLGQKSGHIARKVNVTGPVMGDPEPGRSALDRRKP